MSHPLTKANLIGGISQSARNVNPNGKPVIRATLAQTHFKNNMETKCYLPIVAFGQWGEKLLKEGLQGRQVYIEARMEPLLSKDANGFDVTHWDYIVTELRVLSRPKSESVSPQPSQSTFNGAPQLTSNNMQ